MEIESRLTVSLLLLFTILKYHCAFLYGIAGIGKSEMAKAYAKQYKKYYTNILYVEYTGDLHQSVTDMDFTDDLPEDSEEERFRKHNRFLRSLKDDTLLIIDNFNVTATQDSFLSVVLKYRCRVLFTTRSKFDGHCILQLKEIQEPSSLFQLASSFYSEAEEHRTLVEEIIQTVHRHTFAVELAAKLLENGILPPKQLLEKLREEKASLENEDKINAINDLIDKDDISKYLLFLEDVFPYMEKYHYQKGMKEIIRELKQLLKGNNHGTSSDRALLLDYQATMEAKPETGAGAGSHGKYMPNHSKYLTG